jgi:hypothetical protein
VVIRVSGASPCSPPAALLCPRARHLSRPLITVPGVVPCSYTWDVYIDWGLGWPSRRFLNDRRMGSKDWLYYLAIVSDLFLRFLWVNTLIPPGSTSRLALPLYMNAFLMVMEIIRRSFWCILRLENEHLRNTQVRQDVPSTPHTSPTPTLKPRNSRAYSSPSWSSQ